MDKYELGQSEIGYLTENINEIRLDLKLDKNKYYENVVVYGYVMDVNDKPISGSKVIFLNKFKEKLGYVYSTENGFYSYNRIESDWTIKILVSKAGYKNKITPFFRPCTETIEYNFILRKRLVWNKVIICGHVIDSKKEIVKNIPVYLIKNNCLEKKEIYKSTSLNIYGQFVFDSILRGKYFIFINDPKYYIYCKPINITGKDRIINLNLMLRERTSSSTITGQIKDNFDKPIPFALVVLYRVKEDGRLIPIKHTESNRKGRYKFTCIPYGRYLIKSKDRDCKS